MLDIYVVSLSSSWISDSTLTTLMGRVPARCIVLLEDLDAAFTRSTSRDDESTGSPDTKSNNVSNDTNDSSHSRSRRHKNDHLSDVNTLSLSGLLNALDGVAASEGRILFATTNHLERLDPALSRPGRMDVWVEFRNASKWQAELLFRNFFPSTDEDEVIEEGELEGVELPTPPSPSTESTTSAVSSSFGSMISSLALSSRTASESSVSLSSFTGSSAASAVGSSSAGKMPKASLADALKNQAYLPPPVEDEISECKHSAPPLDGKTLSKLAKEFADSIPDEEFSVASLQGYLLKNKSRPEDAAKNAAPWVISEREMRERLKRERELKEKLAREKRRKELLEKAEEERKAKEEAAKKAEEEKVKSQSLPVGSPVVPVLPVPEANKENLPETSAQDDQSDSGSSSSGTNTPAESQALWVSVDDSTAW